MRTRSTTNCNASRWIWLRRSDSSNLYSPRARHDLALSEIGIAAAHETLVTATPHMAAIWTDLFQSMITSSSELRWRGDGPGIGRDARIAYSSLLGRYMARAYLVEQERVRVLVPLDVAKRWLKGTSFAIKKDPPSRGLEADWIGFDDSGLVIVEAKGTFDKGVGTWCDPNSRPRILQTAIGQAKRTTVFRGFSTRKLPAKRWAIASRWGTEDNRREPMLLAWDPEADKLDEDDYQALAKRLLRADLSGVLRGLGHSEAARILGVLEPHEHVSVRQHGSLDRSMPHGGDMEPPESALGDIRIRVGAQMLEPGFAAAIGLFGVHPLRSRDDVVLFRRALRLNLNVALASMSSQFATTASHDQRWTELLESDSTQGVTTVVREKQRETEAAEAFDGHIVSRAGLTVVWPNEGAEVSLAEE